MAESQATKVDAWQVAHINEALTEARSGGSGVPHEDVVRWVVSWDTEHELPRPKLQNSNQVLINWDMAPKLP